MIPKPPPRGEQVGYLYVPPYRIQGVSIAGEQTVVQAPEFDLVFDIGLCPRIALSARFVALSHGHMDHTAGLPYYFSQRVFQKIGTGTCLCPAELAPALRRMMQAWVDVEQQRTPHEIVGLEPDEDFRIKNNTVLRSIRVSHTVPASAYAIIEHRTKLRDEFTDLPQSRLRDLKKEGVEITRDVQVPIIAYTGDTEHGPYLYREEFAAARIVVTECTFFEDQHRKRSRIGKHLHLDDLASLLEAWQAEAVVLVHLSRRTSIAEARTRLEQTIGPDQAARVHVLMDHQANRHRHHEQVRRIDQAVPSSSSGEADEDP